MKKALFWLIIVGIGVGVGFGLRSSHAENATQQVLSANTSYNTSTNQDPVAPTTAPQAVSGTPVHISIPKINVDTQVESVGMDSKGRMDVPKNADNTAWFSPGFRPGVNGSAVIDGHYDKVTGAPAVFYKLKDLTAGDNIIITDNNGTKYTFAVDRVVPYPDDNFPIKEVFAAAAVPQLNLITCDGTWNKETHNYSNRMVVYSKLVSHT
ncbi:MAG: class F sortase [Candidatus Levyibacteriota bacterium]